MANPYFRFRQFMVHHDKCAMKVGTDGVLLGAWVDVHHAGRILDVGTGTGLIAMMMAQRCDALIDGVELDESASTQAEENTAACPWGKRIRVHHGSFQHFSSTNTEQYDLIVSNPPFFRNSLKSPESLRSLARHDDKLNYESLLFYTAKLLSANGRLAVIIPANELIRFVGLAYFHDLHPLRQTLVCPYPGKDISRCLAEFSWDKQARCIKNGLTIKERINGPYTQDYMALTRTYYL
jgi:tRNA1Val (adenine37-N6)-methyltransferase